MIQNLPPLALELIADELDLSSARSLLCTRVDFASVIGPTVVANTLIETRQFKYWHDKCLWRMSRHELLDEPLRFALCQAHRRAFICYIKSKVEMMCPHTYVIAHSAVDDDSVDAFYSSSLRIGYCVAFVRAALQTNKEKYKALLEPNIELMDELLKETSATHSAEAASLPELYNCYFTAYQVVMYQPAANLPLSPRGKKLLAVLTRHGKGIMDLVCIVQKVLFW